MDRNEMDLAGGHDEVRPIADAVGTAHGLLTPGEVARLFGVDPKTVSRWADAGKLEALRTLGGHRRYRSDQVRELLQSEQVAS